jgi:hypothetical protein
LRFLRLKSPNNPNKPVDLPFLVLAVPTFVRALALIPLLLILRPALPPIRALGLVNFTPLLVTRSLGFLILTSFFLRFAIPVPPVYQ